MGLFEGGAHTLLVVDLFVDCVLIDMTVLHDRNVQFEFIVGEDYIEFGSDS